MSRAKRGAKRAEVHIPVRTCVGCRAVKDKKELVRFVSIDGVLTMDKDMAMPGRGAYICRSEACFNAATLKKGALSRALRSTADAIDLQAIKAQFLSDGQ